MASPCLIVWFRNDLRLADNPALAHACESGRPVVPVFLWSEDTSDAWAPGAASRWYLHHSLKSLRDDLRAAGSDLLIRRTDAPASALCELADELGAEAVYTARRYEPDSVNVDGEVLDRLREKGVALRAFEGALLHTPSEISTSSGNPYQVFTPFYRKFLGEVEIGQPLAEPELRDCLAGHIRTSGLDVDDLGLLPDVSWDEGLYQFWRPGERSAHRRLETFIEDGIGAYDGDRDRPDRDGTSRLSAALHFGELSPRQIFTAVEAAFGDRPGAGPESYLREIVWREFAYHVLFHFPRTTDRSLKPAFDAFPWEHRPEALRAWRRGETGYPIVDAGMRQLWKTGWMHNRVRMIVASFLTKDLLVHWREGARWFWDTLVDADLANNSMGWQWAAGSGADAQPYFRIFNPVSQGKKFDPEGSYVRTWVPELGKIPTRYLHAPWQAPAGVLKQAGVTLGSEYPEPIVDHGPAREAALDAYQKIRRPDG